MASSLKRINSAKMRWPNKFGALLFSIAALIIVTLFPLFVEAVKSRGSVKDESYLLTAAVLAVGFGFTSEGNWFRAGYLVVFLAALGLDFKTEESVSVIVRCSTGGGIVQPPATATPFEIMFYHPTYTIVSVAVLQFLERFILHVVQDRQFPDWLKEA